YGSGDRLFHDGWQCLTRKLVRAGPPAVAGCSLADIFRTIDGEPQLEMRENMRYRTGSRPGCGEGGRIDRRVSIDTRSPWAARNLGHPGEKSLVSPLAQENRSILRDSDECRTRANWLFRFGCLYWKFFRVTGFQRHAIVVKRADRTSRTP